MGKKTIFLPNDSTVSINESAEKLFESDRPAMRSRQWQPIVPRPIDLESMSPAEQEVVVKALQELQMPIGELPRRQPLPTRLAEPTYIDSPLFIPPPADRIAYGANERRMGVPVESRSSLSSRGNTSGQPQMPNKLAQADPKWGNKVAWSSKDLMLRQASLETYSAEAAMLFEAVRTIASKSIGKVVNTNELEFVANFGAPIADNTQRISIGLERPIQLRIMLFRKLVDGKLMWSADVGVTENTPLSVQGKLIDAKKAGGNLPMDPVTATGGQREQLLKDLPSVERRRRVKL